MILGRTVFEIFEDLISCRTNEYDEAYPNSTRGVSPKNVTRFKSQLPLNILQQRTNISMVCLPFEFLACPLQTVG